MSESEVDQFEEDERWREYIYPNKGMYNEEKVRFYFTLFGIIISFQHSFD